MDKKAKIGQALKELRLKKQLKQSEVAEILGISSQQTYQKYESGIACPPYELLCDFADFYGVTADYLLGRETEPKPLEQLAKINGLEITEEVLLEEYMKLEPQKRKAIIDFMKRGIQEAEMRMQEKAPASEPQKEAPAPVPEPQKEAPPIQVKQGQKQNWAIARTSDPEKQYILAPTDEMMELFTPVPPEDLD